MGRWKRRCSAVGSYDALKPFAAELQMGNPLMMKAIARSQEEKRQAGCAQDCRPGALQPASGLLCGAAGDARSATVVALPETGGRAQSVQMKNRMSGLLMEVGAEYNKQRLAWGNSISASCWDQLEEVPESVKDLLRLSRGALETFAATQRQLLDRLQKEPVLVKTSEAAEEHRRGGRGNGTDLGSGGLRPAALPFHRGCGELLRADLGAECVGRQAASGGRSRNSATRICRRC